MIEKNNNSMKRFLFFYLFFMALIVPNYCNATSFVSTTTGGHTLSYTVLSGNTVSVGCYYNYNGNIVIPSSVSYLGTNYSVTEIADMGFKSLTGQFTVTIPNSVTTIGWQAFYGCSGLTSVTIGNHVTIIVSEAFKNCTSLSSIVIPNSVLAIGSDVFKGCSGLTSVTIGSSIESIDYGAFDGCTSLTTVNLNADSCIYLTSLSGISLFSGCSNFSTLNIGNNVRYIPDYSFSGCSSLTTLVIGNQVRKIGNGAFANCSGLTSLTLPETVTHIGSSSFYECTGLTSVTIGQNVKNIGMQAFGYCSNLSSVNFNADSCINVDMDAFSQCNNLTVLSFGNNVRLIPGYFLYGCNSLPTVMIPSSVLSIGDFAFAHCSNLVDVFLSSTMAPTIGMYAFYTNNSNRHFHIPCGSLLSYSSQWGTSYSFVEESSNDVYSITVSSADTLMGVVSTLLQPSCMSNIAVIMGIPNRGYRFAHWNDGDTINPRTILLSSDTNIVGFFSVDQSSFDTIILHDTIVVNNYIHTRDTIFLPVYLHDTVPLIVQIHDTIYLPQYIHDTLVVNNYYRDTIYLPLYVYDTIDNFIHDTLTVTDTLWLTEYDTVYFYDTIVIFDTVFVEQEGINTLEAINAMIYQREGRIVVECAEQQAVTLFDAVGRRLEETHPSIMAHPSSKGNNWCTTFNVPTSGVYLIKIGKAPARRIVIIK